MTRAIMNGCNGKMGQCITGICAQDEDIEIVAGIDTYDGIKNDYPVFSSLNECTVDADVIIDFSNAKAVDALLAYGVEKQIPIVLCTTGLSEQQLSDVEKHTKSCNFKIRKYVSRHQYSDGTAQKSGTGVRTGRV